MTLRKAATFRELALEMCKGKPSAIRELVLLIAGACDDGGVLLAKLRNTPVPGYLARERKARADWVQKQAALLIKWGAHMDIVTSDVGRDSDKAKTFYGIRVGPKRLPDGKSLSEWLDENADDAEAQRTCERVIEALSKGGFVRNCRRSKLEDGKHVGMCSVRKITVDAILQLLPGSKLAWWEKVRADEVAARKAKHVEAERLAKMSPEARAQIDLSEAAAKNAERNRRSARTGAGEFQSVGDLVSRALRVTGPPKPA